MRTLTSALISSHIVNAIGSSGAGKGEFFNAFGKRLVEKGGRLDYVATGDLFREARSRDEVLVKMMDSGLFIPDLNRVLPVLKDRIKNFLIALMKGENVVLALDGAWRIGGYYYEDEKRHIIPQSEQIGIAFGMALSELYSEGTYSESIDWDLLLVTQREYELGVSTSHTQAMRNQLLLNANHVLVDVTPQDGEALMRYRLQKDLQRIASQIPESDSETLVALKEGLRKLGLIQSGQLRTTEGGVVVIDNSLENLTLQVMPDKLYELAMEETRVCEGEVCRLVKWGEAEKPNLGAAIKRIFTEASIKLEGALPRSDDMYGRKRRVREFGEKTVKEVLLGELGYMADDEGVLVPDSTRNLGLRITIVNGPERGVGYQQLVNQSAEAAKYVLIRVLGEAREVQEGLEMKRTVFRSKEG